MANGTMPPMRGVGHIPAYTGGGMNGMSVLEPMAGDNGLSAAADGYYMPPARALRAARCRRWPCGRPGRG